MSWIRRIIRWVTATILSAQVVVITVLLITNRLRRQRAPREFPRIVLPPVHVDQTEVQIYSEGHSLFRDILAAITAAQETILLETFIWREDELGREIMAALVERARAGVQVYVIYDWFANLFMESGIKGTPPELHTLPYRFWRNPLDVFNPRRYSLDHRKILVVDGEIGFIGGYNIGELYRQKWRDTHLRFRGATARDLAYAFADFWNAHHATVEEIALPVRPWSSTVRVHRNDPMRLSFPIRNMYLEAIEHAQKRVLITNAYFIPDPIIRDALLTVARRGVNVQVLIPWQSNHIVADWLARHHFSDYLRGGIRLFAYNGAMIHAKTATIDGVWSMIGTANLDRLSLAGNYEINVEIFDRTVAQQMEAIFFRDLSYAREIDLARWERRPWYVRAGEIVLSPLWPWV